MVALSSIDRRVMGSDIRETPLGIGPEYGPRGRKLDRPPRRFQRAIVPQRRKG